MPAKTPKLATDLRRHSKKALPEEVRLDLQAAADFIVRHTPPKRKKNPSRADRWTEALGNARAGLDELKVLQEEYQEWKDNLDGTDGLDQTPVYEKLEAVCDLELDEAISTLDEAEGLDLPLGFGRD
jgi:hypothetical protein